MAVLKFTLNDGTYIPQIGFGTWQLEKQTCVEAVKVALETGYRHFDTAYAYYNEKEVREGVGNFPREELWITTKLWREFHHPKLVEKACDLSLNSLRYDYIDLYLMHWPEKENFLEILYQMQKLKEKGKVRSIGICNATIHHIKDILHQGLFISMNQIEFHPFLNQAELLWFCQEKKIGVTAYSPLAQGKTNRNETLQKLSRVYRKTPAQISLRWLLQKGLIVIPRSSKKSRIQENFDITDFELSKEDMQKIEKIPTQGRIVNPEFNEFSY